MILMKSEMMRSECGKGVEVQIEHETYEKDCHLLSSIAEIYEAN